MAELWVEPIQRDDATVVSVRGELDLASVPDVFVQLVDLVDRHAPLVVIDASQLTFLDCTGLTILLRTHQHAASRGQRLVIAAPAPAVRRLLDLTHVDQQLTCYASVEDALRDAGLPSAPPEPPQMRLGTTPVPRMRPPGDFRDAAPL